MFFSWYIKNKQFKTGRDLSGQITPFLIIILVILLIAAISTINIGRISLDKTCSANAADAGSLAAASAWAGAFNSLAVTNEELFEYSYDDTYYAMLPLANEAEGYIDEAIILSAIAAPMAIAAEIAMSSPPASPVLVWTGGIIGFALDTAAGFLLLEASMDVASFNIAVSVMQSLTDSFHEQQWKNYCDTRDYMAKSWINASETGYSYAFSNSCIQDKLSTAQGDIYNAWVSDNGPYKYKTYSWQDGYSPPQTHTVSATLDLPNIESYQLQHTVGSYGHINDLLDGLIERSQIISGVLNSVAAMLVSTGAIAMFGFAISIPMLVFMGLCYETGFSCAAWVACYSVLEICYALTTGWMALVVAILVTIVALAGAVSVYLLKDDLNEAFDDWAPDGIQSSTSCGDVSDLLIVKIDSVTLTDGDRWSAICCTKQNHGPGTSAGIFSTTYTPVTSCCTAKFDNVHQNHGIDIGAFLADYDSGITGTN